MTTWRLRICLALASTIAACGSDDPEKTPTRVELSTVRFEVGSGALTRIYALGAPIGWRAIVTNVPDTCALVDNTVLPEDVSYLSVSVVGDVEDDCVIVYRDEGPASACTAYVFAARQGSEERFYKTDARSGRVKARLNADGTMNWDIEATFLRGALHGASCEGGIGAGEEETGEWTCLAVDGAQTTCEGSCWKESCCNAGRTETETLSVSFATAECDPSGGGGGSGGTGGDTSCASVCLAIRECSDPDTRARCLADCEGEMEESCRACYASLDCEQDHCADACPGDRCWSDFECDLPHEYCDIEAAEPRCVPESGGGRGGSGGSGGD